MKKRLTKFIKWFRYGKITSRVIAVDGGLASEIEYYGRFGKVIGYFAYGAWDPACPYKGE